MAGLYLHIPFCKSRCIYCGFYSTVGLDLRQKYVDAVCKEMEMRRTEDAIKTIYLGGGTPSQLTGDQLRQLFYIINKVFGDEAEEVTIECNPDDVTVEFAEALPRLTVNRVSMGAQTFDNKRLQFLHRRHNAEQVPIAVQRLRDAGISNISIDLMYGFPGETQDDWQRDIDAALALDVEHLSAYCLMIEEGTVLYEQMRNEKLEMRNDKAEELERAMYELLIDKLTAAGYEHYEISNFAKPGYRSRHNSSYWHDVPYIGLGAAAHSYDGKNRSWNVADIKEYIAAIERGERPAEWETLDEDTHYNDRITVALRTSDGLDLNTLSERHRHYCMKEAQRFIDDGLLQLKGHHLILTRKGLFVSDMVMSELIYVDDDI
ncbi:MAG: radical SAM family heme chaperone HemW [Prevotella sp.]|nr:radical SAM family heme chaperone HemW [Prevotella sp.]